MIHAYPDCSGTISFSLSPRACHFDAHVHFRRSDMFKYTVFCAPEAKKALDILLARSADRTALRLTHKEILGRLGKKIFVTMIS